MPTPDQPGSTQASNELHSPARVTPEQLAAAARAREYWAGRQAPPLPAQDERDQETAAQTHN